MFKKKIFVLCLFYFFSIIFCYAEEYKQIDFITAVEIAQKNNLDIQVSQIDVSVAKNDIKIANRLQNPSFSTFWNFGEAGKGNPNQIGLSETIELFKRNPRKNLAKTKYKLAYDNYEYDKFNLKMDIAEAYIKLVIAKFILKRYEQQKRYIEQLLSTANKDITKDKQVNNTMNLIQSRIALNEILATVNKAKAEVKIARIEFNKMINEKNSNNYYDVKDIDINNLNDIIKINIPILKGTLPPFEQIKEIAIENRYDIRIAKNQIDVAEKNLTVVVRQLVPDLEIGSGYSYQFANDSDTNKFKSGAYISAGLVNIPLFYTYKPEIKNAKLEVEQANLNYISTVSKALKNLEMSYEKFRMARVNIKYYNKNILQDTEMLFKNFEQIYKEKDVDFSDLVSIEETYYDFINGYTRLLHRLD